MAKNTERPSGRQTRRNFFGRLPAPLSAEEEAHLVAEYRNSRSPRVAARLVEANLRLVVALARLPTFSSSGPRSPSAPTVARGWLQRV
jgi:DNA-directed RNA polymerase sigma subunit (sigma70/sigma32)